MSYLSRVEIDTGNRRKIKDLTHLGAYHNWVEQSFTDEIVESYRTRKLWRIDKLYDKKYLLIVSEEKPDKNILEKYGVIGTAESKKYDDFLNSIQDGKKYYFKTTLNPVISLSQGKGNKSRIKPHVTIKHQIQYLLDRADKNGFELREEDVVIVERGYEILGKTEHKPVRIIKVVYEGVLTITEKEKFKKMLLEGIGKKKAYGFGMMTVIPME